MNKKGSRSSIFYDENIIKEEDILFEGYLTKSPPLYQFEQKKSWKRRYFVLGKSKDEHFLFYFTKQESSRKLPSRGEISIRKITELCIKPEYHPNWNVLQKFFSIHSSENVLLVQTEERGYFFIGDGNSIQSLHSVIASLRQGFPSESKSQTTSIEPVKTEPNQQRDAPSRNKAEPIYASIKDVLLEAEANKQESATPFVEHTFSETTDDSYDLHTELPHRLSQPTRRPNIQEKPRSYSLPDTSCPIYDVPRKIVMENWRSKKVVSADSGIYEFMATTKDWRDSASSIDCSASSEHLPEDNNMAKSDINPDVFITENRAPREESNKGSTINMDSLKTLLGEVTKGTKLEKKDITVYRDDFKNLELVKLNDKVFVIHSDEKCAFRADDQIMAINKLQIYCVEEVDMLIKRSMEEEVLVTIMRQLETPTVTSDYME
ncbi:pleckstrin homology domain-containing family S member 1-like [Leucoraja erinacea]|uniref:pleckstrin homology domain-containing family S member 1-like n=1 Tax=Leucoraja erinaceus TaxID=7782 RepID=UPI0024565696|nr:pleckstrin homology domain-containing family S member 1-like [Leucoraja erinacea]XP_055502867.1 pleckstrin homology domain-containing family S member 1-like [Leucoraja erinacea]XP_055502868.1 pleckstrin homology domain-containing family S member 1-like [Leucoraja erinacea]XP_055502870.1 pleckstrin homology domain-containing family S member 1-like [Leucoraja erinacea]